MKKIDAGNNRRIEYHYDLANPSLYGSANNRLEYLDTFDTTGGGSVALSRTWYYYKDFHGRDSGNVTYVVTRDEPGASQRAADVNRAATVRERFFPAVQPKEEPLADARGSEKLAGARIPSRTSAFDRASEEKNRDRGEANLSTSCGATEDEYTATRMEYAQNGEAVSYVLGERWCWDSTPPTNPVTNYTVLWAREFRYDGARQRYRSAELDVAELDVASPHVVPLSITRSDYDGDDVYADWDEPPGGGAPTLLRSFEPGIGRVEPWVASGGSNTTYYHTDMLGTTRLMTGPDGNLLPAYGTQSHPTPATFTAFGERIQGPTDGAGNRYGYVGEHGYQAHEEFAYLHLGARYYDPASGKFLQRDPIGIRGGSNVYVYALNAPTYSTDSGGLWSDGPSSGADRWGDAIANRPPRPEPPALQPAGELERVKKVTYLTCAAGGIVGIFLPPVGVALLVIPIIDELIHWNEPLNPVWGGAY